MKPTLAAVWAANSVGFERKTVKLWVNMSENKNSEKVW